MAYEHNCTEKHSTQGVFPMTGEREDERREQKEKM
jgi:hypothetical protein